MKIFLSLRNQNSQKKKNCKTNCAAAAAITSKGRIKLYELCLKIGFKNISSLAVDEVVFNNKLSESELLKLMGEFNLKLVNSQLP